MRAYGRLRLWVVHATRHWLVVARGPASGLLPGIYPNQSTGFICFRFDRLVKPIAANNPVLASNCLHRKKWRVIPVRECDTLDYAHCHAAQLFGYVTGRLFREPYMVPVTIHQPHLAFPPFYHEKENSCFPERLICINSRLYGALSKFSDGNQRIANTRSRNSSGVQAAAQPGQAG